MRNKLPLLIPILVFLAATAVWARPRFKYLNVDGVERRYLVSLPPAGERTDMPVLLVLHGGGGTARGTSRQGFSRLSRDHGFLVVYPDGIQKRWNDGRNDVMVPWKKTPPDDVKFMQTLLDQLAEDYSLDQKRICVAGISNGAMMSHRLANELAPRIAAIAPIIGGMGTEAAANFTPEDPVSVLIIQGTADPLVPYNGGQVKVFGKNRGELLSTPETAKLWVSHNRCGKGKTKKLADGADDQCRVEKTTWSGGRNGTEVVLYKVVGGGHTVPGGKQYLPKATIGTVCRDIDGVGIVGEFCARQHKP